MTVAAGCKQATCGHRGRKGDPLYRARRTLHTGAGLLTDKQQARLEDLFAVEEHVPVEATWGIYQRMIAAYREKDRALGRAAMEDLIDALSHDVPSGLSELRKLGRTLKARADDVLAYFERPGTSNGPSEAINGRLEHLRGSALGLRNLTNYIVRAPGERRFQTPTTPSIVKSRQTRLNASTRAELLDGYASGVPVRVLAERFGVHRSTVREIAAKAKISPRRRSLSERDAQEATRLYTDGMTLVEVSARLGVGDEAVRAAVVACGGTIRPRGRRPSQLRRPNDH